MPERSVEPMRGLPWVLGALAAAVAPHVPFLPGWISLLIAAALAWRWAADRRAWPLPPRWLRVLVAIAATLAVLGTYRTLNGRSCPTCWPEAFS